ncbi:DUF192 domain-containing protein [Primorskyibacter aestuariivivens]|uniref:DUF192 domain-containing protein n=1 Tax=Primorskyibacter aestuariivivens TaxID=1888912 RepID=UPI002301BCA8|nr:DUF192 domain-containing protein [Primorskyibacter aestuariivivens]MDA7429785.1 DUF192 domain-containing protein [Primorskyibacter aestuariivivens]
MGKRAALQLILCLTLAVSAAGVWGSAARASDCRADRIDLRAPFGTVSFTVEIADTMQSRARGLMHRTELAEDAGMLFIYAVTREAGFWMKNTLIPLDMIFINARGIVHKVHSNAQPHDLTGINSDGPIRAVLEINGGLARKLGIRPGTVVRHPGLPQARAAWPC